MTAAESLLRWLVDGSLAVAAASLLVLALRRPLRRAFGARVAYAAWALLPLALLAATLPRPEAAHGLAPGLSALQPGVLVMAIVGTPQPTAGASGVDWPLALLAVWLSGATLAALRFRRQQRRYLRTLGPLWADGEGHWRGDRVAGPAVVGALRPRIVLPTDFEARHAPEEAALVLAHERAHLARGDTRANLAAVALRCLQWFNPLLHLAAERFRLDQELACDATVLARHPHARRRYADAMLNVQLAVPGLPVGCHWQSSQSLKERILMLKHPNPGALRRRTGILVLGVVLAGSSYAAWAVRPASPPAPPVAPAMPAAPKAPAPPPAAPMPPAPSVPAPSPVLSVAAGPRAVDRTPPPKYPPEAAQAHIDGRVVLKLLVRADGTVKDVVVEQAEPAGVFDAASVEAARMWTFTPAMKDGKAVEGWVRVPVDFRASEDDASSAVPVGSDAGT